MRGVKRSSNAHSNIHRARATRTTCTLHRGNVTSAVTATRKKGFVITNAVALLFQNLEVIVALCVLRVKTNFVNFFCAF